MTSLPQYFLTTNDDGIVEIHSSEGIWASIKKTSGEDGKFDVFQGEFTPEAQPQYEGLNFDQVAAATQDADVDTNELEDFLNQI